MNRNFRAWLDALLERKGYVVVNVDEVPGKRVVKAVDKFYRVATKAVKDEYAQAVMAQPRTTPDEVEKLKGLKHPTPEDRLRLERYYAENLNGHAEEDLEQVISEIPDKVREWVHRLERLDMTDEALGQLQRNLNTGRDFTNLKDVYHSTKLRRELLDAPGGVEHTGVLNTDRFIQPLRSRLQEASEPLETGFTAKNVFDPQQENQTVHRFLQTVGLKTRMTERQQMDGERTRLHQIDPERQAFLLGILERRKAREAWVDEQA